MPSTSRASSSSNSSRAIRSSPRASPIRSPKAIWCCSRPRGRSRRSRPGSGSSGEIDSLRKRVSDAESRVEDFRSKSSLFVGTNNTTLSNQQMGEINTQLNNARALKSDAEIQGAADPEMLQSGKPIEASEVLNSELIRRLSEQRATLRAQLAEQSSTLLDGHPRIKELKAQLADLDRQVRDEASKVSRSLDNDARIAGGRVESLSASLDQLKKQATSTNGQDVQLRALEREAKAQRDLLESYLAKYREATTRENIETGAGRRPDHFPRHRLQYPGLSEETADRADRDAGDTVALDRPIATGELLRMTAPRALGSFSHPRRSRIARPRAGTGEGAARARAPRRNSNAEAAVEPGAE